MAVAEVRAEFFNYEGISDDGLRETLESVERTFANGSIYPSIELRIAQKLLRQEFGVPPSYLEKLTTALRNGEVINPARNKSRTKRGKPLTITPEELSILASMTWGYVQIPHGSSEGNLDNIISTACAGLGTNPLAKKLHEAYGLSIRTTNEKMEGEQLPSIIENDDKGFPCFTPDHERELRNLKGVEVQKLIHRLRNDFDNSADLRRDTDPRFVAIAFILKAGKREEFEKFSEDPKLLLDCHVLAALNTLAKAPEDVSLWDIYEKACKAEEEYLRSIGIIRVSHNSMSQLQ